MKSQKFTNLVQLNAESVGIKALDNEIISYLNIEIEEKLKMILLQAKKYMRVSRRKTLKVDDLNHSLELYNIPPLYGYDSYATSEYERNETINSLWRPKQNIIDLEEYLSKPISTCPMQSFPHFHWFAIEGKRPNISENFIREEILQQKANPNISPQNHYNNMNQITSRQEEENKSTNQVVPPVIHNISKELQIFFENFKQRFRKEVKMSKMSQEQDLTMTKELEVSINVIKTEPGVVELLPYIIEFLMSNLSSSTDSKVQIAILYYIDAMLINQFFFLEPYLHQIITLLLSLILMEVETNQLNVILKIKTDAIRCLKILTHRFQTKYPSFIFQLLEVFKNNLLHENQSLYLTTFGSINSIVALGSVYSKKFILPLYDKIIASLKLTHKQLNEINADSNFLANINSFSNDIQICKAACVYFSLKETKRVLEDYKIADI